MKEITFKELNENMISRIGSDWMLITSGDEKSFNMMTASWGGVGFMWGKPVAVAVIRPIRHTFGVVEQTKRFTLSFFEDGKREMAVLGSKSGRDMDKMHESGFTPFALPDGQMGYKEAWLTLECEVLYQDNLKEENFLDKSLCERWYTPEQGGYHMAYVAEIKHIYVK